MIEARTQWLLFLARENRQSTSYNFTFLQYYVRFFTNRAILAHYCLATKLFPDAVTQLLPACQPLILYSQMYLLEDSVPRVKAAALRAITLTLAGVSTVPKR